MITIIFEPHGTTFDNENHISSGWSDAELSELGQKQAKELRERYKNQNFDGVFCSDLQRSYKTAEIAFAGRNFKIIRDERLRECNYGNLTRQPDQEVRQAKAKYLIDPFPNGESYEQTAERMRVFLKDLLENYDGKRVMIIGHRATQHGLEHWINKLSLEEVVTAPWKWQPGWTYYLNQF